MGNPNEDETAKGEELFKPLQAPSMGETSAGVEEEDELSGLTVLESLCMACEKQGETRLMLTDIPYFRKVVVMSFRCKHCNWRNTEVQSAETIQEKGVRYELQVKGHDDLNRQVIKSEKATIIIPELELEMPPEAQRGSISTVEGVLTAAVEHLSTDQPVRKHVQPEAHDKIEAIISRLNDFASHDTPTEFKFVLDDPTGNSFVQNPVAPQADPAMSVRHYTRTAEQDESVGLPSQQQGQSSVKSAGAMSLPEEDLARLSKLARNKKDNETVEKEVITFPGACSSCAAPGETRMVVTDIPHFKEIVLMSFVCDQCGFRSNEVKAAGAISAKATRVTLNVTDVEDMNRDVLKSETATVEIPEIHLRLEEGTLGGRFTTIEGLVTAVKDQLFSTNRFMTGDSSGQWEKNKFEEFIEKLDALREGKIIPFTFILDDPVSNSYIQNVYAPDDDPEMTFEEYERTFEQDEELGLHDINTESYETT